MQSPDTELVAGASTHPAEHALPWGTAWPLKSHELSAHRVPCCQSLVATNHNPLNPFLKFRFCLPGYF